MNRPTPTCGGKSWDWKTIGLAALVGLGFVTLKNGGASRPAPRPPESMTSSAAQQPAGSQEVLRTAQPLGDAAGGTVREDMSRPPQQYDESNELQPQECGPVPSVRSREGMPTTIEFVNQTSEGISIYWIDYDGRTRLYSSLQPERSFAQSTYVTHPWLVKTSNGRSLLYWPTDRPARAIIRG
jgi:hypothetical protein